MRVALGVERAGDVSERAGLDSVEDALDDRRGGRGSITRRGDHLAVDHLLLDGEPSGTGPTGLPLLAAPQARHTACPLRSDSSWAFALDRRAQQVQPAAADGPELDALALHREVDLAQVVGRTGCITGSASEAVGVLRDQDAAAALRAGAASAFACSRPGPRLPL